VEENPSTRHKNVVPLNGRTFSSVVIEDATSDVFVFFTKGGDKCELCQNFWPGFIEAAIILERSSNLIFATIDLSHNEVDWVDVYYFPTVRYYPRNNKKRPLDYSEGLDAPTIISFIKKVATVSIVEDYSQFENEQNEQPQVIGEAKKSDSLRTDDL